TKIAAMTAIIIRRSREGDQFFYEVENFEEYARALQSQGLQPPPAKYRIIVPRDIADEYRRRHGDLENQVLLFYRVGSDFGIDARILDDASAIQEVSAT